MNRVSEQEKKAVRVAARKAVLSMLFELRAQGINAGQATIGCGCTLVHYGALIVLASGIKPRDCMRSFISITEGTMEIFDDGGASDFLREVEAVLAGDNEEVPNAH